jgi:tocopherol cyclase
MQSNHFETTGISIKASVQLTIENRNHKIEIIAQRNLATKLASPIQGLMDGKIEESMTSIIHVKLIDKKLNQMIFVDSGRNAGLEVAGAIADLIKK